MIEYMDMIQYALPLLAIGGAWGGAKVAFNGSKQRISKVEETLEKHDDVHIELIKQGTRMETKIDMLLEKK